MTVHRARSCFSPLSPAWRGLLVGTCLLVGVAGSSLAATYYVSPSGNDSNSGLSASTPWATAGKANSTLRAGDLCQFLPGTYGALSLGSSGTPGSRITVVGSLANPSAVSFSSVMLAGNDYVTIKGVSTTGNFSVGASAGGLAAMGDSLLNFVALGSLSTNGVQNCVFDGFRVGQALSTNTKWDMRAWPFSQNTCGVLDPNNAVVIGNTFRNGTLYLGTAAGNNAWEAAHFQNNLFDRLRIFFYMSSAANSSHPFLWYVARNNTMRDCYLNLKSDASFAGYLFAQRDSSRFNVFLRDTFTVDTTRVGRGKIVFDLSGNSCTGPGSCDYNSWRYCLFDGDDLLEFQNGGDGDSITFCQIYADNTFMPRGDSLTFAHNTVYSRTAMILDLQSATQITAPRFHHNIFYSTSQSPPNHVIIDSSRLSTALQWDYNLYYSPANDSTNATLSGRVGPGSTLCNGGAGWDCHSRWMSPQFTSPQRPTPNLAPKAGSPALSPTLWPDGYVGAIAQASIQDVIAPANITDLAAQQVGQDAVVVAWTATGDDGMVGNAASYELRWSTSPITAVNFTSATLVNPAPAAAIAGTLQTYVVLGLQPAITYYFALRARDEVGNTSGLSNTLSATTLTNDLIVPAPIMDLSATP